METKKYDLIVIGAGPGGYVAAIRAAQLGLTVACVEKEPSLGGTCLRIGCIPSKALLESSHKFSEAREKFSQHGIRAASVELDLASMLKRKDSVVTSLTKGVDFLFKKNKITSYTGTGKIIASGKVLVESAREGTELTGTNILIATGSKSAPLSGVELDGEHICTSAEALSFAAVPKHLVVIGAGYIGLELGSVWKRLGAKVTVLEFLDRILPGMDAEIADDAKRILEKQGIQFRLGAKVTSACRVKDECVVETAEGSPLPCDKVLLAVGRIPNTDGLGLDSVKIALDKKGRIPVGENFETSAKGIFAVGDVIPGPMLAHKAEEEGVACVEKIVTGFGHVNYDAIPGVAYTHPEIASVGKTEEQLREAKVEFREGIFHLRANGRALALGESNGKIKILSDAVTDRILGVHAIGPHAGDLINEAAVAINFGASSEDLARTCHAHPTLGEALKEAALAVDGRAIHS